MKQKELDINDDMKHEQLKWKIERIGRYILLFITAAALAGLLGSGPVSSRLVESKSFILKYNQVERYQTPTELEFTTRFAPSQEFSIWVNDKFIKQIDELTVLPEPKTTYVSNNKAVFVFEAVKDNKNPVSIRMEFKHNQSGFKKLMTGIDSDFIQTTQIILP